MLGLWILRKIVRGRGYRKCKFVSVSGRLRGSRMKRICKSEEIRVMKVEIDSKVGENRDDYMTGTFEGQNGTGVWVGVRWELDGSCDESH